MSKSMPNKPAQAWFDEKGEEQDAGLKSIAIWILYPWEHTSSSIMFYPETAQRSIITIEKVGKASERPSGRGRRHAITDGSYSERYSASTSFVVHLRTDKASGCLHVLT